MKRKLTALLLTVILTGSMIPADVMYADAATVMGTRSGGIVETDSEYGPDGLIEEDEADTISSVNGAEEEIDADEMTGTGDTIGIDEMTETADTIGSEEESDDEATETAGKVYRLNGRVVTDVEEVTLDLEDEVLQFGGFPTAKDDVISDPDLTSRIADAVSDEKDSVDVSDFGLSVDEITDVVADVINDNPSFFYLEEVDAVYDEETGIVLEIMFAVESLTDEMKQEYADAVSEITSCVDPAWTDVQKLLYLHDTIVTSVEYDLTYKKHSAYEALVEHDAVCSGYALAFIDLSNAVGINATYVSSDQINHAWNLVEVSGKKYYIDCTWDDPTATGGHWYEMCCKHSNFLRSEAGMIETNHLRENPDIDWVVGSRAVAGVYVNTDYDDAFWINAATTPFVCREGEILYYTDNSKSTGEWGTLCRYDADTNEVTTLSTALTFSPGTYSASAAIWTAYQNSYSYWSGFFGTLQTYGNDLYVNDSHTIYKLDQSNDYALDVVYTVADSEINENGPIYSIRVEGNRLKYKLAENYSDTTVHKTDYIDLPDLPDDGVQSVTLDHDILKYKGIGAQAVLNAEVAATVPVEISWSSTNPAVATVEDGVVTVCGYGVTTISARAGSKWDTCRIEVDTVWQDDYTYIVDYAWDFIEIYNYRGTSKDVFVPSYACVDGTWRPTILHGSTYWSNSNIETVVLDDGVSVSYPGTMFGYAYNLKSVDLSNTFIKDWGAGNSLPYLRRMFEGSSGLESIDFSGCDFSMIYDATAIFKNCQKLAYIKTPAKVNPSVSMPFPSGVVLYEYTNGTYGTVGYTDLSQAPASTVLRRKEYTRNIGGAIVTLDSDQIVYTGTVQHPEVTVTYIGDVLTEGVDYTVTYADSAEPGTYTVTVTGKGDFTGTKTASYEIIATGFASAEITLDQDEFDYDGQPHRPAVTLTLNGTVLAEDVDYTVTYDEDAVSAGEHTVTVEGIGDYRGTRTVSYTINGVDLSTATVTFEKEAYEYTQESLKPDPIVKINGRTLIKDTDYSIGDADYSDNYQVGTATVKVTGIGGYSGCCTGTFQITPADITKVTVNLRYDSLQYAGRPIEPRSDITPYDFTVKYNGSTVWYPYDYSIGYANNDRVGTASIILTGKRNFTGTKTVNFEIVPGQLNPNGRVTLSQTSYEYNGQPHEPSATVTFLGITLTEGVDYEVLYDAGVAIGNHTVTVTGKGNYTGTLTATYAITQPDLANATVTLTPSSGEYNGAVHRPSVTVVHNGVTLTENTHYTVSYDDRIDAGTSTVTVTGKGSYTGTNTAAYTIKRAPISGASLTLGTTSYTYDGTTHTPSVTVTSGENTLTRDTDYTVAYDHNKSAGTGHVTVTGKGNYTGTVTADFTIAPADISEAVMTMSPSLFYYDGTAHTPGVTVKLNDTTLSKTTDYEVAYEDNTDAGTGHVTVTGKGNYTGTVTGSFEIKKGTQYITAMLQNGIQTLRVGRTALVTVTGAEGTLSYESSDEDIVTVDDDGKVTAVSEGEADITVYAQATDNYDYGQTVVHVIVSEDPGAAAPAAYFADTGETIESGVNVTIARRTYVILESTTPGAEIYYTTDGTNPALDEDGEPAGETQLYTEPIPVFSGAVIYAFTRVEGYKDSAIVTYEISVDGDVLHGDVSENMLDELFDRDPSKIPAGLWYAFWDEEHGYGETAYESSSVIHCEYEYTGSKITFNDSVKVFHGTRLLMENRDYTLSYARNINAFDPTEKSRLVNSAYAPAVTVKGKGNYTKSATFWFKIAQLTYWDAEDLMITTPSPMYVTSGTKLNTVKPVVKFGKNTLVSGTDYRLVYKKYSEEDFDYVAISSNALKKYKTKAGETYQIEVWLKGGRNITADTYIPPENQEDILLSQAVDVQTVSASDRKTYLVSKLKAGNSKSKTITLPYVTPDAPGSMEGYLNDDGSVNLEKLFDNSPERDDGKKALAFIYKKKASSPLVYGRDYTVRAAGESDHKSAGTHSFIISGIEKDEDSGEISYVGEKTFTYKISGTPLSKVKIAGLLTTVQYTGDMITAEDIFNPNDKVIKANATEDSEDWKWVTLYTVTGKGRNQIYTPLKGAEKESYDATGADYIWEFTGRNTLGKCTLKLTGRGRYTGSVTRTITVKPYDIKKDPRKNILIQPDDAEIRYSKAGVKPAVTVSYVTAWNTDEAGNRTTPADSITLREGIDYTLSYKNNAKVVADETALNGLKAKARPTVTVKGMGNFTGADASTTFCIQKAELSGENKNISVFAHDVTYNSKGKAGYFYVVPKIMDGGKALTSGKKKDLESYTVKNCTYTYAEDTILEDYDETEKHAGNPVDATDKVPEGTRIAVDVALKCTPTSPYTFTPDEDGYVHLKGEYRVIGKGMDISKATVKVIDASKVNFNNTDPVVLLESNLRVTMKGAKTPLNPSDYKVVPVRNNRFLGTATVTIYGKGEYGGCKTFTFKIKSLALK